MGIRRQRSDCTQKKGTRVSVLPADGEITVLEPSGLVLSFAQSLKK